MSLGPSWFSVEFLILVTSGMVLLFLVWILVLWIWAAVGGSGRGGRMS